MTSPSTSRGVITPFVLVLGVLVGAGLASVAFMAFIVSGPDTELGETVRLMYVHVPSAITTYVAATIAWVASIVWLKSRSLWWDIVAESAGEIAAIYAGLTILTGMLWGKPTWGQYWVWDARLTTMLLLFLLLLGHRTLRASTDDPEIGARRAAFLGLLLVPNILIVNRSVEWWRSLHQDPTIQTLDAKIEGWQLTTLVSAIFWMFGVLALLLVIRFRLGWLARQASGHDFDAALAARRAESTFASIGAQG